MYESIIEQQAATDLRSLPRRRPAPCPATDRLPPSSVEAEQGVLGCVLLSPKDCMGDCVEKMKAGPECFYDLRHQSLFQTLVEMWDKDERIDLITLQQRLKDGGKLDGVGGLAYLASLPDTVPSAAGLDYYLQIVLDKYALRQLLQTCASIVSRVYEHEGEVDALLAEAEHDIAAVTDSRVGAEMPTMRENVHEAIGAIEEDVARKGALSGIGTGFVDLDKLTGGLQNGEMAVIAARPSVGKTALALNIAEHAAVALKVPVGVFSLEMARKLLVKRMIASRARVNLKGIADGFLSERDFPKLTGAAGVLAGALVYIDDSCGLSILQLRAKARRMHQRHGVKLFVVDYLQLLHSTSRRVGNREQEIADISGGLKSLAKELDVAVLVLSQLNRELDKRKGGTPQLSDLRESGSIEQDADFVGMLYRDSGGDPDNGEIKDYDAVPVKLKISKQRNGPTGEVDLTFMKTYTRFESAAKVALEDVPT